jgi:hypothetical protein
MISSFTLRLARSFNEASFVLEMEEEGVGDVRSLGHEAFDVLDGRVLIGVQRVM